MLHVGLHQELMLLAWIPELGSHLLQFQEVFSLRPNLPNRYEEDYTTYSYCICVSWLLEGQQYYYVGAFAILGDIYKMMISPQWILADLKSI